MVIIDGKEVHKIENRKPSKAFKNVKVFAGDPYHKASDASYRDLKWENIPYMNMSITVIN